MKTFSAEVQAALASGHIARAHLIWVELDTPVGFWTEAFDAVVGGKTYLATYGGMQVSPRTSGADLAVRNLTILINGLDTEVSNRVLAEEYHQKPIYVSTALIGTESNAVIGVDQWFGGWIDRILRKERLDGVSRLEVMCEGIGREFSRSGARTRSDPDQRQLDPNDPFFQHAVAANNIALQWGRERKQNQKQGGIAGFLDRIF